MSLKTTMPAGVVRDAILSSPAWPDIAADMGRLDARGIDVARILVDAHRAGAGVNQAVAAVTTAAASAAWGWPVVMSRRQRRVAGSVLAGVVLAVCGWWVGRLGYGALGLLLSSSAGVVVLVGVWRAGALRLPRPALLARDTAPRRPSVREREDLERSARLLNAIAVVAGARTGGPGGLSEFERIVLQGVAGVPGREYPRLPAPVILRPAGGVRRSVGKEMAPGLGSGACGCRRTRAGRHNPACS
ncbi:hypothetical protein [Streptomyces erythrochromogenes]|uniref:hypothetical protein n=1 Tax=Streptomyces erythrochromogenes TaxID=285574 RepID=UPI003803110C